MVFVLGIRLGIALGKLGDFGQRLGAILPHEQMRAVGEGRKEGGILGVDAVAEALQFQVAHDLFLHQAGEVGGGGDAISGPDFFGDGASADQLARFEDDHAAAGAGQIRRGDQSVVAAADNDDVKCFTHKASMIAGQETHLGQFRCPPSSESPILHPGDSS